MKFGPHSVRYRTPSSWVNVYPVHLELNWAHRRSGVFHGPKSWPWWRLFSWQVVRMSIATPSSGWRLWAYWGGPNGEGCPRGSARNACHADLTIDRRRAPHQDRAS